MDRYLYKAKRTDNGEWVVGYIIRYGHTGKEKYYIVPSYASDLYAIEIDTSTICRCIGSQDKNGKLFMKMILYGILTKELFTRLSGIKRIYATATWKRQDMLCLVVVQEWKKSVVRFADTM